MWKKINNALNILMGSCIGVFIGHGLFEFWDHRKHPDLYAMQPAPWYTGILVYGGVTIAAVLVLFVVKLMIRGKLKQE